MAKSIGYEIVEVVWEDPTSGDAWHPIKDCESEPHKIRSVGFLVKETATHVTIALSLDLQGENCAQSMTIPETLIHSMHTLEC